MTATGADWRVIDGVLTTWFDAGSLTQAAELVGRWPGSGSGVAVELRPTGVRVRLGSDRDEGAVSAAARDLGLVPNPAVLQQLSVVVETADPADIEPYWQRVLDYTPIGDGLLVDPLRRDPTVQVRASGAAGALRNRLHLDVVRPASAVEHLSLGEGFGPFGVRHADPDGNEVDLVPGDPLSDRAGTEDWQAVFGALACYRTTSPEQQRDLAAGVAAEADRVGFPLLVDLRPGLVIVDSGKDRWDADAHGVDVDFAELAVAIQTAARDLGAIADLALPRFVQLFLDATDVAAARSFWAAALGYRPDRRSGITDLDDPRGLGPVLVFQPLDPADTERQRSRDRLHLELAVPVDTVSARVTACLDAGGRLVEESADRRLVGDPEGNELVIVGAG